MLIKSPKPYSRESRGLLTSLGIDPPALAARATDAKFYDSVGLGRAVFFDRETFGRDFLAVGIGQRPWKDVFRRGAAVTGRPARPRAHRDG
jgi:spermidine dehydrogenase